jgi:hypothetical protein
LAKIGIITEGPIDYVLLDPLLSRIAQDKANFSWPVVPDDVAQYFPMRKRGHGGVLKTVRSLVRALDRRYFEHAFFVILLDRRTEAVQAQIRRDIRGKEGRFVLGLAIEEIEAWWLGDRTNTLAWSRLQNRLPAHARYAARRYRAEGDDAPKRTLDELTRLSDRFDRVYGKGSVDLATQFAQECWRSNARLDEIAGQCPKGFRPFQRRTTRAFRQAKAAAGRLF